MHASGPISAGAVLVAGGSGRRAGGSEGAAKQFRLLGEKPVIKWCYDALAAAGCRPIVVVVPPGAEAEATACLEDAPHELAGGGTTRTESVYNGLVLVDTQLVVIHDAVRPFATTAMVHSALAALADLDGAVVAVPVEETIKRVDATTVVETVDRSSLWRAQTPQAFRTDVLRRAHEHARASGRSSTDDAQLVEAYGGRVGIVPGSRANLKITYADDFALAEAMLAGAGRPLLVDRADREPGPADGRWSR